MGYSHFEALPTCAENSYLPGYMISESVVGTLVSCLTLCVLTNNCRSVNVWSRPRNITCQLNWSIVDRCSDLASAPGVQYLAMEFASCSDVKRLLPTAADGEYKLKFGQHWAQVYCHNISGNNPLVSVIKVFTNCVRDTLSEKKML